jgi:Cytochrome c3
MRSTMRFIAVCWLAGASPAGLAAPRPAAEPVSAPGAAACLVCHPSARGVLSGPMATRAAERGFCRRAFGASGERFFAQSCTGCHVKSCDDCHGASPHRGARLGNDACTRCHKGYFVGWDFQGRAPREDHARYQRGPVADGEPFLKMLPDVHAERGMTCADCHTMRSLQQGRKSAKTCRECHPRVSRDVPEHATAAHLDRMECEACHSAWAPQEYGTFLVRALTADERQAFSPLRAWGPFRKSAYLKLQDAPPLGLNERGKVAPIRPQFVLFATDASRGWENRLLAAEWKAFFPHTVRRGTVTCSECHDSRRRFVLEKDAERLYEPEKDGLPLRSFWSHETQTVVNGSFFPEDRYLEMNRKTPEYVRQYLKQWQNLLDHADPRSRR